MTTRPPPERLEDRHYVTLLLRLLVDSEGAVVHGEVMRVMDSNEHSVRFRGNDGLLEAVQAYLASEAGPSGSRRTNASKD